MDKRAKLFAFAVLLLVLAYAVFMLFNNNSNTPLLAPSRNVPSNIGGFSSSGAQNTSIYGNILYGRTYIYVNSSTDQQPISPDLVIFAYMYNTRASAEAAYQRAINSSGTPNVSILSQTPYSQERKLSMYTADNVLVDDQYQLTDIIANYTCLSTLVLPGNYSDKSSTSINSLLWQANQVCSKTLNSSA